MLPAPSTPEPEAPFPRAPRLYVRTILRPERRSRRERAAPPKNLSYPPAYQLSVDNRVYVFSRERTPAGKRAFVASISRRRFNDLWRSSMRFTIALVTGLLTIAGSSPARAAEPSGGPRLTVDEI